MDYLYLVCFLVGVTAGLTAEWFTGITAKLKSLAKRLDGPVPPPPPK